MQDGVVLLARVPDEGLAEAQGGVRQGGADDSVARRGGGGDAEERGAEGGGGHDRGEECGEREAGGCGEGICEECGAGGGGGAGEEEKEKVSVQTEYGEGEGVGCIVCFNQDNGGGRSAQRYAYALRIFYEERGVQFAVGPRSPESLRIETPKSNREFQT